VTRARSARIFAFDRNQYRARRRHYRISTREYEIAPPFAGAFGNGDRSMKQWPEYTKDLSAHLRNLRSGAPEVMKAFSGLAQAALAPKALDGKSKELIALGIAVAIRCDDCIGFHVKAALEQGASREEVLETLGIAVYMGAGPSVMYANHALDAFEQFKAATAKPAMAAV
jgi:AhpD family alkylhydroperoxidase